MFYIKQQGTITEITSKNVFTHCMDCGQEIPVDLAQMVFHGRLDLSGTSCRCEDCSYKHALQHRGEAWADMLIGDYTGPAKKRRKSAGTGGKSNIDP